MSPTTLCTVEDNTMRVSCAKPPQCPSLLFFHCCSTKNNRKYRKIRLFPYFGNLEVLNRVLSLSITFGYFLDTLQNIFNNFHFLMKIAGVSPGANPDPILAKVDIFAPNSPLSNFKTMFEPKWQVLCPFRTSFWHISSTSFS